MMEERNIRIREIRKRSGLTQKVFGTVLGIPIDTIRHWETGKRTPPEYVVSLIEYRMAGQDIKSLTDKRY
jgi:DNA-binding transcriptional regulator YiaG